MENWDDYQNSDEDFQKEFDEQIQEINKIAESDCRRCLELTLEAANDFFGGDAGRGKFLFDLQNASARALVNYYCSTRNAESCFETIELVRSIGLRAATDVSKTDASNENANDGKNRRKQAERRLNELETQFETLLKRRADDKTTDAEYRAALYDLNAQIVEARDEVRETAAFDVASRPIFAPETEKPDFDEICQDFKKNKTLALEFATFSEPIFDLYALNEIAVEGGSLYEVNAWANEGVDPSVFLLAFGYGLNVPKLIPLEISEEDAAFCKKVAPEWRIEEGPLRAGKIERVLRNGRDGVLDLLAGTTKQNGTVTTDKIDAKLNALWSILTPDKEIRTALTSGDCERVLILPDGALATFPFETLVVEPESQDRKYFLDACPPTLYAPSIAIYRRLKEATKSDLGAISNVLTLGNAKYPKFDAAVAKLRRKATEIEQLQRELIPLPGSGRESSKIAALCERYGKSATRLSGAEATEKNLRASLPGVEIACLATHGFVDDSNGNRFGALATAEGVGESPEDDGFLTVAELEELDLSKCRLCAMSACDVGRGSIQLGEGVFSLGRAAFCAGARRALTTDWSLNDDSAAFCVSSFIENVFKAEASGETVDYAKALRDAKIATRRQKNWRSPFFWAPFELWGVE